jgi:hypothetical protein
MREVPGCCFRDVAVTTGDTPNAGKVCRADNGRRSFAWMMGAEEGERFARGIQSGLTGARACDSAVSIREEIGICLGDSEVALGRADHSCRPRTATAGDAWDRASRSLRCCGWTRGGESDGSCRWRNGSSRLKALLRDFVATALLSRAAEVSARKTDRFPHFTITFWFNALGVRSLPMDSGAEPGADTRGVSRIAGFLLDHIGGELLCQRRSPGGMSIRSANGSIITGHVSARRNSPRCCS